MSQTIFPTLITSSFIPQLWTFSTGFNREYADLHYVKFPIAQGSQSFPLNLSVSGTTSLGATTITGSNNITLGDGSVAPTAGQLGYTLFGTIATTSNSAGVETTVSSINLTAGTWLCSATVQVTTNQTAYSGVNYTSIYNTTQTSKYCLAGLAKGGAFTFYNNLTIVYIVPSGTQSATLIINPTTATTINTTLSYFSATRIA
jgi:hypothetical protein